MVKAARHGKPKASTLKRPSVKGQTQRKGSMGAVGKPVLATKESGKVKKKAKGTARKPTARRAVVPLDDRRLGEVPGVPTQAQIDEAAGPLSRAHQGAFKRIQALLAEHLGSHAAARLWLVSSCPGYASTPLEAIRHGQAKVVLAGLESQWGRGPIYA